jgi:hypothetical protein
MGLGKFFAVCSVVIAMILAGLLYLVQPYVEPGTYAAIAGAATVVVGIPLFAMFVNWWVNEAVYGTATRRPPEH